VRRYLVALSAAAGLLSLSATAVQAAAAGGTGGVSPPAGVVSALSATGTPELKATNDHPAQQIRQLVQCGGTMYAVGSFNQIIKGSTSCTRTGIFSFKATSPYTVTSWAPRLPSGAVVNSIAKISTSTGNVVAAFAHNASGSVQTVLGAFGHILAGGYYTSINGSGADPYMTSLNPATGKDDGFVHLNISGHYEFPGVSASPTRVFNQALSHSGRLDLVMGDFTSVGGRPRQQIFMLNLATSHASVTAWTSPEWDGSDGNLPGGYPYQCAYVELHRLRLAVRRRGRFRSGVLRRARALLDEPAGL
jgi:hypothetical protein